MSHKKEKELRETMAYAIREYKRLPSYKKRRKDVLASLYEGSRIQLENLQKKED